MKALSTDDSEINCISTYNHVVGIYLSL